MADRTTKTLLLLILIALLGIILLQVFPLHPAQAQSPASHSTKDNEELARLYLEDQNDRTPERQKLLGWEKIGERDKAREKRVKELYAKNALQTGADYYHAAMILQHADLPEDYLLAHELCVVGVSKGEERAKSLAAKSEDRFLMSIDRPQRFGTQFVSENNGPFRLYTMDTGVTDDLRRAMNVPPLAEAKAREAKMNRNR